MSKKYTIFQKLVQTDYYTIEANSAEEALKFYKENIGEVMSDGSTGGWAFRDTVEVLAACDSDASDQAFDLRPTGRRKK